ncbi:MAG: hypothetical protein Q7U18_13740 [Methylobacter sp.]|nr:hypothetical protein [Methylobacter sp.]
MKIQSNSAQISEQTANPRILSTANALTDLFELSKNNLSDDHLKWFSGLLTPAITEAVNISGSLNSLASARVSLDGEALLSPSELANILFGLSDQIDNIRALMEIVDESIFIASQRQIVAKTSGTKKPA